MGKKNKFYELWTAKTLQTYFGIEHEVKGERGGWSKHKVDIFDAVAMGLVLLDEDGGQIEPEDLRLALADDEAWHQEYLCEFIDETTAWLPYDLIEGVEDIQLNHQPLWAEELVNAAIDHHEQYKSYENPPEFIAGAAILADVLFPGELYLGFDVARRRDLSIIWLDEVIGDLARNRAVIDLRKQPFGVQRLVLFALLRLPQMRRGCIDETGIGMDLAEKAVEIFGENTVEAVTFTAKNKEALATGIRKSFEDRKDRIPADTTIRNSLHTIKKISTSAGNFRFDADREETTGHADHFWAKALAVQARQAPVEDNSILTGSPRESYQMAQGY
jgi:phage FluMu gp28-like protein